MGCRIRKSVWLSVLIIIVMLVCECEGRWKQERDALLHLKAIAGLKEWGEKKWVDGTDCCRWSGVRCNTRRRVSELNLSWMRDDEDLGNWYLNLSDFQAFDDIKILQLHDNNIAGFVEKKGNEIFLWQVSLESLDLSVNQLSNDYIISFLSGFQHLKSLDLSYNQLEGSLDINGICALSKLERLDLSYNFNIGGFVVPQGNERFSWQTCRPEVLALSHNNLSNDITSSFNWFSHLKFLDLSYNQLEGSLDISGICALSKLEELNLSYNDNISGFVVPQGTNIYLDNLKVLHLEGLKMDGSMLRQSLRAFSSVRELYMNSSTFNGTIVAADFGDLVKLEKLILDESSNIGNEFLKSIGVLTSLKVLSLNSCGIKGSFPIEGWSELKKLEVLSLNNNKFEGSIGLSFINTTSLRILQLSNNYFAGNFGSDNLGTLNSLEYLDFSSNQFEVLSSFDFLANYSNLKTVDGSGNRVITDPHPSIQTWVPKFQLKDFRMSSTSGANSVPLPNFLIRQYNLTYIDVSDNKFRGDFPNWLLENNTKLEGFYLRNCSFTGRFQLPSHVNPYLGYLDASYNMIIGEYPSNISTIFPNLQFLDISWNAMNGSLPHEFGGNLEELNLSNNNFSGEIPRNLSVHDSSLQILRLSNNRLIGSVCPILTTLKGLVQLLLDGNSFSGIIPSYFFNATLRHLDISNNHFVGKLPHVIANSSNLVVLSIANNHLEGSIPTEIIEQQFLSYLDLSSNNLSGSIPSFVLSPVEYVLLSNNRFSGLAKTMFNKSWPLVMLDLSNNNITGKVQHLIGSISQLNILLLRGNHFRDHIPNMCHLKNLELIDLSYNSLSGPIPNCLGKFPSETQEGQPFFTNEIVLVSSPFFPYVITVELRLTFTTKQRSYTYKGSIVDYMSGIDLSHNNLNGSIPPELGNLMHIRAINLSHNHLSGQIPITFSNLKQVESLDLSFNNLNGEIPYQLTELTFLEVLNLANNNLSGSTPERKGQFITFDESSYEGNPFLCGPPLNKSCMAYGIFPNASDVEAGNNGGIVDMEFFYINFVVSYTSILLVMAIVLYINPQWRRAWFYFIESTITYSYYYLRKCFTNEHM